MPFDRGMVENSSDGLFTSRGELCELGENYRTFDPFFSEEGVGLGPRVVDIDTDVHVIIPARRKKSRGFFGRPSGWWVYWLFEQE
jgi:hypothetical protein